MTDTIVLVTGVSQGIGLEILKQLVRRGGFHVIATARTLDRAKATVDAVVADEKVPAGSMTPLGIEVSDDQSIDAAAASVKAQFGKLDILINNAGISGISTQPNPGESPRPNLRAVYETNVFGVAAMTDAFLPLLRASKVADRRIVNVTSSLGRLVLAGDKETQQNAKNLQGFEYRSSKAAVNMLSVCYGMNLIDEGIACIAATPGHCRTAFTNGRGRREAWEGAADIIKAATEGDPQELNATFQTSEHHLKAGWWKK